MEQFDYKFGKTFQPSFDLAPEAFRHRLMGVDYVRLQGMQGGDLFVTRHGWNAVESVLPEAWFIGEKFRKVGRALAGATSAVYRVPVPHPARSGVALVVKFSRAAQDVGLTVIHEGLVLDDEERACVDEAEFLSPFAEFGAVQRLRAVARWRIPTKQPLAVYCPPTRYQDWELGRKSYIARRMNQELLESQSHVPEERRISYDWGRLYILIYRWIEGIDAEQASQTGLITPGTMTELGQEARATMRRFGWMVCDHKPRHVVIRQGADGQPVRRRGKIVWGLIDYELLVPITAA